MFANLPLNIDLEASEDHEIAHSQGAPHFSFDVNDRTILLKNVPVFMTRSEIKTQID